MVEMYIDGQPASTADLGHFVLSNYGAFTSMVVEDGAVRGLDLHLERLKVAALDLFGVAVSEDQLRQRMRQALGGRGGQFGLRVNLFSPDISLRQPHAMVRPKVLTSLTPALSAVTGPVRVSSQLYERELAHLKHNATLGLTLARRRAVVAGFDDALFVDRAGLIIEGSTWNIGLVAGDTVVWPRGPQLTGTGMTLLQKGLAGQGLESVSWPVFLGELDQFQAAFLCNSTTPACAISSIDNHVFAGAAAQIDRLQAAFASNPCQVI